MIHENEKKRFTDNKDNIFVWHRKKTDKFWSLTNNPLWEEDILYVVNDIHSEIRKKWIDKNKPKIEFYSRISNKWKEKSSSNWMSNVKYRIKENFTYPIYAKSTYTGLILKFNRLYEATVIEPDKYHSRGVKKSDWISHKDRDVWKILEDYEEVIYYYQWENLVNDTIYIRTYTTEDLSKEGFRRIESSKRIWNKEKKMKNKKQKIVSKNIMKNIAIVSCIGTVLNSAKNKTIDDFKIERRCSNAIKVFCYKAGSTNYANMANIVKNIWDDLVDNYSTEIQDDAILELARTMTNIMSPKVFKELLAYPQPVFGESDLSGPDDYKRIFEVCIRLDEQLNIAFGTNPITLTKPIEKKVKIKRTRDKSKKLNAHDKQVLEYKKRRENIKQFIRERAEKARQNLK